MLDYQGYWLFEMRAGGLRVAEESESKTKKSAKAAGQKFGQKSGSSLSPDSAWMSQQGILDFMCFCAVAV